ncbi:glycosyltransferase family protein [Enterovirga sp. CN4-39]|uniref:glycosyltransferase family protein n=1 Tax=Enterovirga sp. CN4-39 TaxID=3400910 RepID=UPI003BFE8FD1
MSLRVLIAVTHLLGAGHLTRAAAIGRALAAAGHEVTLVSGGRPTAILSEGGFRLVQLPPVQARVGEFTTLRDADGREIGADYLAGRRDLLLATLRESAPDILVTELFPFGRRVLASEFMALLEAAHALRPRPLVVSSVRDILAAPSGPEKLARTHDLLARLYDAVLVHGDPALAPLEASWPARGGIGAPILYTGYVDTEPRGTASPPATDEILVSGGSSAAGLPLYRAALAAARLMPDRPWRILVGRGISEADNAALDRDRPDNVRLEPARPDFRELMAASALFVGQAGYNTVLDLLAARPRAVLVPFEQGNETEQRLRAKMLAEKGIAIVLPEAELNGDSLARAVRAALTRPRPDDIGITRDGAGRTAEILARLAQGESPAG